MSKKANPTTIGLFIVIGLTLGACGLLLFSSSRLFSQTAEVILYFNESLNGLNQGAPVKYRGVTIGSVKRVMINFNQATNDYAMPVIIEVQKDLLQERLGDTSIVFSKSVFEERVNAGLRGSLQSESLVTGVLYVGIQPDPNAPPAVYHQLEKLYLELPTEPTQIQQLMSNLASLDIKSLENKLNSLLSRLDTAVGELKLGEINRGVTNVLAELSRIVDSPSITNLVTSAHSAIEEYRQLAKNLNGKIDPLAAGVTNTLAQVDQTLLQLRGGVQNLRDLLAPDSSLRNELTLALEHIAGAAESISALTEFLQSHPNALITGRQVPSKKQ